MQTSFQEFLSQKSRGSDWKERKLIRLAWLRAVDRLLAQVREFLREADPEGVLETTAYQVERVEEPLGVYDAPALKIRLGTESADVVPVGRFTPKPLQLANIQAIPGNENRWGNLTGGRVDITNGERRHLLFRSLEDEKERWYALLSNRHEPIPFDRACLEAILQDLLS